MVERGFTTITISKHLYHEIQERAKNEDKKAASYASEIIETMFYVEDRYSRVAPLLKLISLGDGEDVVKDNKLDRIVGVKTKDADGGKVRFYCQLDNTDYCPHTAFAGLSLR